MTHDLFLDMNATLIIVKDNEGLMNTRQGHSLFMDFMDTLDM